MASTTAETHSSDSRDMNVSSSSEPAKGSVTGGGGEEGDDVSSSYQQVIKNNQEIRSSSERHLSSNQSDDDVEERDDDSNECGGNVSTEVAVAATTGSNNGFHDDSSESSTSSGSRIPVLSSNIGSGTNAFNVCSPMAPFPSSSSKSNPFCSGTSSPTQHRPILRPSAFKFGSAPPQTNLISSSSTAGATSSPFVLRAPKLVPASTINSAALTSSKQPTHGQEEKETPTFVPLEKESSTNSPEPQTSQPAQDAETKQTPKATAGDVSSSFVFGHNLSERVLASEEPSSTSGVKRKIVDGEDESKEAKKPVVEEGAREGQPLLPPQDVITGEEDEVNVLQIQCRLFIFDGTTSTWIERGRGLLRLNDSKDTSEPTSSRVIIRSKGSLRVMLNTKLYDGMKLEKAGDKSIRLPAVDLEGNDSALRIFLVMANSIGDANTLVSAIESRIRKINQEGQR